MSIIIITVSTYTGVKFNTRGLNSKGLQLRYKDKFRLIICTTARQILSSL